ncbi:protoporphyrinogen oxidase [Saccharothrix australiensis]|uniref:Protoporphyrinogen oxidase n=1 Tax=Saccharothrix australiensis TaxID=2072 RepID=A0A495W193_9PSEU|nr:protoporphyrinogen oxidase [Saccharothrix australiensis]
MDGGGSGGVRAAGGAGPLDGDSSAAPRDARATGARDATAMAAPRDAQVVAGAQDVQTAGTRDGKALAGTRVAVLGGGICGLATAYRLARSGADVTLLEGSDQLGGLGTFFRWRNGWVERFYHCLMPTDDDLLGLLGELGLRDAVRWRRTSMGMVVDGCHYPFNSALDLLRFRPLPPHDRVRFGVVSLLLRRLGRGKDLDRLRTEDWLRGVYGDRVWRRLLAPMFGSKFGAAFGDVPALYLWERLGRESNVSVRGYPAGGYKAVIDALASAIERAGGVVRTAAPVRRLAVDGGRALVTVAGGGTVPADRVVSTLPLPVLREVADADLLPLLPDVRLPYQGVVNALFFLRRPLSPHYWAPVVRSGTDFDGVIGMSALTGPVDGRHLVYVMRYTDRESALYRADPRRIAARWTKQLVGLYPDLTSADVNDVRVFKAPFVEPVYPLGYLSRRPPVEVAGTPLLLATTAHVYPAVTSWNSSVGLANRVAGVLVDAVRGGAAHGAAAAGGAVVDLGGSPGGATGPAGSTAGGAVLDGAVVGAPQVGAPQVGASQIGASGTGAPQVDAPQVGAPVPGAPAYGAPVPGAPPAGAPVQGAPAAGEPVPGAPGGRSADQRGGGEGFPDQLLQGGGDPRRR